MRILLLSNLYPPYTEGGAEILASDVATGLERLGHEVLVLTSSHGLTEARQDGHIWRILQEFPVAHFDQRRSVVRQFNQIYNYYRRYRCPANARELRRIVSATSPDLLYVWEVTGIGVTSLLKALADLNVPTVFHLGSYWLLYAGSPETEQSRLHLRKLKQKLIGTFPLPTAASFIAVSATVKQKYVEAGINSESIEVIYNGIDPHFFDLPLTKREASGAAEGCCRLLFIGRLRIEKGLFVILKALDLLMNERGRRGKVVPPIRLDIFGSGDKIYIDELLAFIHERHLTEVVILHGWVPQEELITHYDRSDIMLVPSLWKEPFGLVIAEAMARGLPVIASNLGGPAEILTHNLDCLLVPAGDEHALASAIEQLLENPDKRKQLSQAARTTARERFTIEENARLVEQHLWRVFERTRAAFDEVAPSL